MKDQGIETLRTVAMFWIVFAHVGGITPGSGLGFATEGFMQYLMQTIGFFPIPAFVLVSGYLYARKPSVPCTLLRDVRKAAITIVVPALIVGALFYLIKSVAYGQTSQMSVMGFFGALLYPHTHLWFLYALFWTYMAVMLLDAAGLLRTPLMWISVTLSILVFELAADLPINFLSLYKLPYMLPFFLMGYGLQRFGEQVWTPTLQKILLVMGAVLVVFNQWTWFSGNVPAFEHFKAMERMMSWCLLPLIFLYRPSVHALAVVGPLTFIIYLLHPFAAGLARLFMYKFTDISHPALQIALVMSFSVFASIAAFKCGIWFIGRLQTLNAKEGVKEKKRPQMHNHNKVLKAG